MGNCMIGFPNRIDSAVVSGGSWVASLPRTNVQNRILGKVARTTDAALASTKLDIDLGKSVYIRVLDARKHNLSLRAKYRWTAANASTFAVLSYDSGWTDVWPSVTPPELIAFEDDNFWAGQYTDEERAGYVAATVHVLPKDVYARYWRLEIDDTTNAAGYIEIGRIFIGPTFQPENNMSFGASVGWEVRTEVQETYSGSEYFDVQAPYRVARFSLDWLSQYEGMAVFDLLRQAGIDKEVLYIFDPDDKVHAHRRNFLGRLRQLSAIEYPYVNTHKTAFEIKEST